MESSMKRLVIARAPQRRRHGFSLIELLIAVSIMLILAGVVAVNLLHEPGKARQARAKSDLAAFKTALQLYLDDNGTLPTQRQGLQALVEAHNAARSRPLASGRLSGSPRCRAILGQRLPLPRAGRSREPFEIVCCAPTASRAVKAGCRPEQLVAVMPMPDRRQRRAWRQALKHLLAIEACWG